MKIFTSGDIIVSLEHVRRVDRYPEKLSITIWYTDGTCEDLHFSDQTVLNRAFGLIELRLANK